MDTAGQIELVRPRAWWFTHTPAEAVQYLRVLAGEVDIPAELRPLTCSEPDDLPDDLAVGVPGVDAVVVEVSTLKALEVHGLRLNQHKVWGYAKSAGVPIREALSGSRVEWPATHSLLTEMRVGRESPEDVKQQLLDIQTRLGAPVLTVDHLYATTTEGLPVPGRSDITELLADLATAVGVPFHSTRPLIERHGEDVALQDQNHYATEFEPIAGRSLLDSVLSKVLRRQLAH